MKIVTLVSSTSFSKMKELQQDMGVKYQFNPNDLPRFNETQVEALRPDVREEYLVAKRKADSKLESKAKMTDMRAALRQYEEVAGNSGRRLDVKFSSHPDALELQKNGAVIRWVRSGGDFNEKIAQGYIPGDEKLTDAAQAPGKGAKGARVLYDIRTGKEELVCVICPGSLKKALDYRRENKAKEFIGSNIGFSASGNEKEALEGAMDKVDSLDEFQ